MADTGLQGSRVVGQVFSLLKRRPLAWVALAAVGAVVLTAILAPVVAEYGPNAIDLQHRELPPGRGHPLGTDHQGRDILSRIAYGARVSLSIGLAATLASAALGSALGLLAGYAGGKVDALATVLVDITFAFPSLLLAIGIAAVLSPSVLTVLIALSLVGWAGFARLVRGLVVSLKECEFLQGARATGCSHAYILFRHLLPNCVPLILVAASLRLGGFILAESGLSFLGLGPPPSVPTWGSMVSEGSDFLISSPWISLFPGLAIAVTIVAFNLLGDALRDVFDPRLRDMP